MEIRFPIRSSIDIIIRCHDADVPAKCTAALIQDSAAYGIESDAMLADIYADTLQAKSGLNDEIYQYSRKVLNALEQSLGF